MFKPTYLYIKTHDVTGLKYFGKTTQDPYKYCGSGVHWRRHLKIHGQSHSTQILGLFTDEEECRTTAIRFSRENDIVRSSEWANLKEEDSKMGGATRTGYVMTDLEKEHLRQVNLGKSKLLSKESRQRIIDSNRRRKGKKAKSNRIRSKPVSEETRRKISLSLKGNVVSLETREKIRNALMGRSKSEETKNKLRQNWKNRYSSIDEEANGR